MKVRYLPDLGCALVKDGGAIYLYPIQRLGPEWTPECPQATAIVAFYQAEANDTAAEDYRSALNDSTDADIIQQKEYLEATLHQFLWSQLGKRATLFNHNGHPFSVVIQAVRDDDGLQVVLMLPGSPGCHILPTVLHPYSAHAEHDAIYVQRLEVDGGATWAIDQQRYQFGVIRSCLEATTADQP